MSAVSLPELIANLAEAAGFEVRPGLGQFELLGSIDSLAIIVEELLCSEEGNKLREYFNESQESAC